eukprot:4474-Heterococcus_DN1.PRE.6
MRERAWGRAQRTIQLPDDAEIDKAKDPELKCLRGRVRHLSASYKSSNTLTTYISCNSNSNTYSSRQQQHSKEN